MNHLKITDMTQNELDKYIELYDKFQLRCEDVCKILKPLNSSYVYLSEFDIEEDEVYGRGYEYFDYGEPEYHSASFPLSCICMPDDKIKEYVKEEIRKKEEARLAEQARIQKINTERLEKQERKEYERLREKYGDS